MADAAQTEKSEARIAHQVKQIVRERVLALASTVSDFKPTLGDVEAIASAFFEMAREHHRLGLTWRVGGHRSQLDEKLVEQEIMADVGTLTIYDLTRQVFTGSLYMHYLYKGHKHTWSVRWNRKGKMILG